MSTREEILNILKKARTELEHRYGVTYMALFGSYARGEQGEDSDIDILIEVDPSIGLRFVEIADYLEELLGARVELVSTRAIKHRYLQAIQDDMIDVA
ncbi:MAG: nucleotidyltransferase [Gaiellales bacterium]|nr:MAG: nucleotidyltransferase [Gaiellales bacterium]